MNFDLNKSIELLERTPRVYKSLFYGLSSDWGSIDEGENTWNAYNIIGHLIYGEQTDWIPRARIILSDTKDKTFEPYDRFAQDKLFKGVAIDTLLDEFEVIRLKNIEELKSWNLTAQDLDKEGIHPDLGSVTLRELIATWTIHDLGHLNQISRVIVKHYGNDVGPWAKYSRILTP